MHLDLFRGSVVDRPGVTPGRFRVWTSDHRAVPLPGQRQPVVDVSQRVLPCVPVQVTLVPDAIGVGTIEIGARRYALLRLPSSVPEGMNVDVVLSFADLGALVAESDALRSREVAR